MTSVTDDAPPVLTLDGVRKYFALRREGWRAPKRHVHAVDDVTLTLGPGRTLGIVGESGCGKSTLGRVILGLEHADAGAVRVGDNAIAPDDPSARGTVQAVFQDPASALDPRRTVGQSIAEALPGVSAAEQRAHVHTALEQVGLTAEHAGRYPHELSGGQQQRVCIARAIVNDPALILLDEAVTSLDASLQAQVLDLLTELQKRTGVAFVFISHDLRAVRRFSDQVAVMYLGQIVELAPAEAFDSGLAHPYSVALRSTEPRLVPDGQPSRRIVIDGEPPSAVDPPPGCRFASRCPVAEEACREAAPRLERYADGHLVRCIKPGALTTGSGTSQEQLS